VHPERPAAGRRQPYYSGWSFRKIEDVKIEDVGKPALGSSPQSLTWIEATQSVSMANVTGKTRGRFPLGPWLVPAILISQAWTPLIEIAGTSPAMTP
jgi:hypothetical protein